VPAPSGPAFVVLRRLSGERWELLGEVRRRRGLTARAARTQAILEITGGQAKAGEEFFAPGPATIWAGRQQDPGRK